MYTIEDIKLKETCIVYDSIDKTPMRPTELIGKSLLERINDAWMVLINRADAFVWPKSQ